MQRPISIVTVTHDTQFFVRLLVDKVREFIGNRAYEIVVVDRGSKDGTVEWLRAQRDVRILKPRLRGRGHGHGEAAETGAHAARYDDVVLLDSDAHPIDRTWLELTADQLDERNRLAGAAFHGKHKGNPHGWYVHPHFMAFRKRDLGELITLRKLLDWDTGEAATVRLLERGFNVIAHELVHSARFDVGHPHFPTIAAGVFHAWYGTRIKKESRSVARETNGAVSASNYLEPLQARLREVYQLDY
ncbi:MAG TPA: glycosyltransferase [Chthoniobacterales bacterium]|nr:glycosyltransferase [Chthoniobacterales bacterium]